MEFRRVLFRSDCLKRQVGQSRIDVRLGTLATPESIAALSPEMVIVATGAIRAAPSIPGADLDTVFSGDDLRRLMLGEDSEALSRKTGLGSRLIAKAAAVTGLSANIGLVRQATRQWRSEEHTSELQSLMRSSYAVFCLKKKQKEDYTTKARRYQKTK